MYVLLGGQLSIVPRYEYEVFATDTVDSTS
jgi:hypothetical protein